MHPGWAMLVVAGEALAIASRLGAYGMVRLRASSGGFQRSQEELRRNREWLRMVLVARRPARSHE